METVLLSAGTLSWFIVIQSVPYSYAGYACIERSQASIVRESVFSTRVKIEVERATSNPDRYVHLRFCNTNKYWQVRATHIIAESSKPEEDTTNPSCTLFEAVRVNNDGVFYLIHVQSRRQLAVNTWRNFEVDWSSSQGRHNHLTTVNWDSLVKLPPRLAFKGYNDSYLGGKVVQRNNHVEFTFGDPNAKECVYEVHLMDDGHVRVKSRYFDRFWRRDDTIARSGWIWADATDTPASIGNVNTHFWPIKLDDNTIALRNAGNNNFCRALTADRRTDCLDAIALTIVNEARLVARELVLGRKIYNVRYWMENSRIFNETPFAAGTTQAFNYSDSEAAIAVEVGYEDTKSYSFSRSLSLTAGVTTTIEFGLPVITGASIAVSYEISTTLEWNDTTTTTISVKATGSVPVPPRSLASVSYVGTMGTCDVPFSYTQQDTSSTDGSIIESEEIDGVFRGVNAYNFSFVIDRVQPL